MKYSVSQFIEPGDTIHFDRFIDSTFPDADTQETALYALSLFISGVSSYRIFQVWHGGGRNGKSTLMEIMKHIMGERAITFDPKLLLAKKIDQGVGLTPELATFQGALVACGSETEENKKISTGLVKHMTGGETVKANPKHRDPIEFEATWQLVLATNDLPFFSASDNAFVDRLLLLPFKVKFARTEAELKEYEKTAEYSAMGADGEKLKRGIEAEGAAIIHRLIKSYVKLRDDLDGTIPMSDWCTEKKSLYIQDNDDIRPFIENMCEVDDTMKKGYFAASQEITQAFRDFVGNQRISPNYVTSAILKSKRFILKGVKRVPNEMGVSKQARGLENIQIKVDSGTEVEG
jgi:P4 family phage/plasmid primase-like protien